VFKCFLLQSSAPARVSLLPFAICAPPSSVAILCRVSLLSVDPSLHLWCPLRCNFPWHHPWRGHDPRSWIGVAFSFLYHCPSVTVDSCGVLLAQFAKSFQVPTLCGWTTQHWFHTCRPSHASIAQTFLAPLLLSHACPEPLSVPVRALSCKSVRLRASCTTRLSCCPFQLARCQYRCLRFRQGLLV